MLPIFVWLMTLCAWATDLEFGYSPSLGRGERPMFSVRPTRDVAQMVVRIHAGERTYEFERSGIIPTPAQLKTVVTPIISSFDVFKLYSVLFFIA